MAPPPVVEPRCVRRSVAWLVPPGAPGGGGPPIAQGHALAVSSSGKLSALWTDPRADGLALSRPRAATVTLGLGGGEHTAPLLALAGELPVVAWVRQRAGARAHVVAAGDALATRCEQPEAVDDGLSVALAPVGSGALVAWDEELATGARVMAQVVPLDGEPGPCPAPRALSAPEQDAADPMALALPDGGAAVFWLAARDLEASVANETASEVYGVAVSGAGVPRGPVLRLTSSPGHRFGLRGAVAGGAIHLAFRASGESDNEARGDGGAVMLVRSDTALTHASEAQVASAFGATPTGAPVVLASPAGVEVWWLERRTESGSVVAVRRAVGPTGAPEGDPADEPALQGRLPSTYVGAELLVLEAGPRGEPGVGRYRCGALSRVR